MSEHPEDGDDFGRVLERQVARQGDRPLITWYGAGPGERVELSWRTFDNWVAKTANLLVLELGVEPGADRVATVLPAHWQLPVVLAACWVAGVTAVPIPREDAVAVPTGQDPARQDLARVAFVHEELVAATDDRLTAGAPPTLVAVSADPLGRSAVDLGRALPFARAAAGMPDHFDAADGPWRQALALLAGGRGWSQAELLAAAGSLAGQLGLGGDDRLYSGLGLETPAGATAGLALPLLSGAGVVLEASFRPEELWRRLASERVAAALLRPEQVRDLPEEAPGGLDLSRLRTVMEAEEW